MYMTSRCFGISTFNFTACIWVLTKILTPPEALIQFVLTLWNMVYLSKTNSFRESSVVQVSVRTATSTLFRSKTVSKSSCLSDSPDLPKPRRFVNRKDGRLALDFWDTFEPMGSLSLSSWGAFIQFCTLVDGLNLEISVLGWFGVLNVWLFCLSSTLVSIVILVVSVI